MAISAKDVVALRTRTGLGMMECKKALAEAGGDMESAIALLREKLGKDMEERSERAATEGRIGAASNGGSVAMVELKSETDFAAKTESFIDAANKIAELALACDDGDITPSDEMNKLVEDLRISIKENISFGRGIKMSGDKVGAYVHHNGKVGAIITGSGDLDDALIAGLCQHVTAAVPPLMPAPKAVDQDGLAQEEIEKATAEFVEEAKASGKPEEICEKIAQGKLRKWVGDNTLMGQPYVRDMEGKKPIRDHVPSGATVSSFLRYELGDV
jgi:elongation factor Ts